MEPRLAVAKLKQLYDLYGQNTYGEDVTQRQHAVQTARLAEQSGQPEEVVLGACFHDVGHLLVNEIPQAQRDEAVYRHQLVGAQFMRSLGFSPLVTGLVESHVDSKRYLSAVDSGYLSTLSRASLESLAFQGGPMSEDEITGFDELPDKHLYIRLRYWDDQAKLPNIPDTGMEAYFEMAQRHLQQRANGPRG